MEDDEAAPLAGVTSRAGLPGSADQRRYAPGQGPPTEQQLRTLVEGVPHLIWRSCDRGLWTWASPQWLAYTGQTQAESHGQGWLDAVHPEDRQGALAAWQEASGAGQLDVEFRVRRDSDQAWVWHRTTSLPARDEAGRIIEWLGSTTDVQAYKDLQAEQQRLLAEAERHAAALQAEVGRRQQAEERMQHLVFHDDLTGLHNRRWLLERLGKLLDSPSAPSLKCVLVLLDLDRFSMVNDSFGHQMGDRLLAKIARKLSDRLDGGKKLVRLGGDEFAVLLEAESIDAGLQVGHRIVDALHEPVRLDDHEVFTSGCVGVAFAEPRATVGDLVRDADLAMYAAKRQGLGSVAAFSPAMGVRAVEALRLETDLRHALDRREIAVHYQPICDTAGRQVVGVEALARWRHPTLGVVPPGTFIPAAERAGLIRKLGMLVLHTACAQSQRWREHAPELTLSVNASSQELCDRRFLGDVEGVLAATGFDPRRLQLEVTESVFLEQPDLGAEVLGGLRSLGIRVALDDFGMGYSSLGYLSRYPVDTLKIDRTFVAGMLGDAKARAVVAAIQQLGTAMQLHVVAEGVEEEAQLKLLQDIGCQSVQGYLLGKPMPVEEFVAALHAG